MVHDTDLEQHERVSERAIRAKAPRLTRISVHLPFPSLAVTGATGFSADGDCEQAQGRKGL